MSSIPRHVAIIMDGNGRWARQRGLSRARGHEQGARTVERVVDYCLAHGIPELTLYAFSAENWGRPKMEVAYLMEMLYRYLKEQMASLMKKQVRIGAIGELEKLPAKCRKILNQGIEQTANNTALHVTLALSYGGRQEITLAARRLAEQVKQGSLEPADITPELFATQLDTAGTPDPDLLIRTSGEMRLSNFLLWQLSYTELWVTPVLWPDFADSDFDAALEAYAARDRRFGKR